MATGKTNEDSMSMRLTLFAIRNAFPKVKQLETEVLESWMKGSGTCNLILLDVREIDEFTVSHLPNAISVKPDEPIDQVLTKIIDKINETPGGGCVKIVAYCSLGYRSSSLAQKLYSELKRLKEAGSLPISVEVYNLEGSIFKWANEGKEMVDCHNKKTEYCHPYNAVWGKLLAYNLRKYSEASL